MPVLAVGDRRSPAAFWPHGSEFLSLEQQGSLTFRLAKLLPLDHYGRKNLGYLVALARGATLLFDTDDDSAPLPNWRPRCLFAEGQPVARIGWVNIYSWFSTELIWPRGIPLEVIQESLSGKQQLGSVQAFESPIQQGLVNGSPDVDAVWRLVLDKEFCFNQGPSIWLEPGTWCPFNSQSTWWFPDAFPLMYLPSFVSFRMTDIWRSFVAQRCLWELGKGIMFHGPESYQTRNPHSLLRDFEQEIPGYLNNSRIVSILERAQLSSGLQVVGDNLHRCYEALIAANIVPSSEMQLLEAWLHDLEAVIGIQGSDGTVALPSALR